MQLGDVRVRARGVNRGSSRSPPAWRPNIDRRVAIRADDPPVRARRERGREVRLEASARSRRRSSVRPRARSTTRAPRRGGCRRRARATRGRAGRGDGGDETVEEVPGASECDGLTEGHEPVRRPVGGSRAARRSKGTVSTTRRRDGHGDTQALSPAAVRSVNAPIRRRACATTLPRLPIPGTGARRRCSGETSSRARTTRSSHGQSRSSESNST